MEGGVEVQTFEVGLELEFKSDSELYFKLDK